MFLHSVKRHTTSIQRFDWFILVLSVLLYVISHYGLLIFATVHRHVDVSAESEYWWYSMFLLGLCCFATVSAAWCFSDSDYVEHVGVEEAIDESSLRIELSLAEYQTLPSTQAAAQREEWEKATTAENSPAEKNSCQNRDVVAERVEQPYFDNAKYIAIHGVVNLHYFLYWQFFYGLSSPFWILVSTSSFVMPFFAFTSGYLGSSPMTSGRNAKLAEMVITYLWVQLLYYIVFNVLYDNAGHTEWLDAFYSPYHWSKLDYLLTNVSVRPYFHLWYLQSLMVWRLICPFWMRLRFPVGFSFLFSLLMVMANLKRTAPNVFMLLSEGSMFGLFPIYILGVSMKLNLGFDKTFRRIKQRPEGVYTAWFIVMLGFVFWWYNICGEGQECHMDFSKVTRDSDALVGYPFLKLDVKFDPTSYEYKYLWASLLCLDVNYMAPNNLVVNLYEQLGIILYTSVEVA
ncbi:hypothetical protein CYMTET_21687 [Cymbomonas tetramitiformis]|uniref:Acyltransferase 3 domain-containing protein n=1 Tax=Cymbomonas tetramitiformis TaxID=36881 RepID=A0AAE0G222_9CHLO|nr:hypothetical protein CYMTET_21687 [Cymbomonas tetramitiformis]